MKEKGGEMSVLDAGCGEGNYLIPLAKKFPKSEFKGLDYNKGLVDFVNHYCQTYKLNAVANQADLNTASFTGTYDLILCVAVMQMLKDDAEFVRKVKSALNKNGLFVLNVPIAHSPILSKVLYENTAYTEVHGGIFRKYTVEGIVQLLESEGFKVEDKVPTNGFWGTLGNEFLNFGIDQLQKGGVLKRLFFALLFTFPILPMVLICNVINAISSKKRVSGIIISARHAS